MSTWAGCLLQVLLYIQGFIQDFVLGGGGETLCDAATRDE